MTDMDVVVINRAPVLTLWTTVVAERLGFSHDEALTLGKAVAGLNAYSKGKALGIFEPAPAHIQAQRAALAREAGISRLALLHRAVPVMHTSEGLRAVARNKPIDPASVEKYLASKFKGALGKVTAAMSRLAASRAPEDLAREAYALYEKFRPPIPTGQAGWGAAGELSLKTILALAADA